jgi:hypothetical protein
MLVTDLAIHQYPWTPNNTSADVNPKLAKAIIPVNAPDALEVTLIGDGPYQGALVSCNRPIPIVNGYPLRYFRADWRVTPSYTASRLIAQFEQDSIGVWPPPPSSITTITNKPDGSTQLNAGYFQVDKVDPTNPLKRVWVNTSIKGLFVPEVDNIYTVDYLFDWAAKQVSVLQARIGTVKVAAATFPVDASLQKVPFQDSNWALYLPDQLTGKSTAYGEIHVQAQMNFGASLATLSSATTRYTLDLYWSDSPSFS